MSREAIFREVGSPKVTRPRESSQPLLSPYRMGDLDLPNRVIMAPLTRMRANPDDHVPTILQAEYYAQRASAGLIIAEATAISPEGFGWADTPGLWSEEQFADGDASPMRFTLSAVASSHSCGIQERSLIPNSGTVYNPYQHRMLIRFKSR